MTFGLHAKHAGAAQIATESLLHCFENSRLLWQVAEFALSSRVIGSLFMHMRAYYFFPRLICACETSCFHFAHNGSAHAAPHACSASGTPGNSSPVCLLMHTPTLFCFFLCLRNLTVFYLSLICIWYKYLFRIGIVNTNNQSVRSERILIVLNTTGCVP